MISVASLVFAGLLNFMPLHDEAFPSSHVTEIVGSFEAGGMVALRVKPDVFVHVDGLPVKTHDNIAVFGYGRDAQGDTEIIFSKNGQQKKVLKHVIAGKYRIDRIEGVEPIYVSPPPSVQKRIAEEAKQKRAARQSTFSSPDLQGGFLVPLAGRVSGVYGAQRFFNGKPKRPHYGIDIAVPAGTVVRATLSGRVTLAETDMFYEGGLVFIDHGLDLVSAYLHLDKLRVKVGDIVKKGDIIARVGSRQGRSTGPHLDWRLYWKNRRLNPEKTLTVRERARLK